MESSSLPSFDQFARVAHKHRNSTPTIVLRLRISVAAKRNGICAASSFHASMDGKHVTTVTPSAMTNFGDEIRYGLEQLADSSEEPGALGKLSRRSQFA